MGHHAGNAISALALLLCLAGAALIFLAARMSTRR